MVEFNILLSEISSGPFALELFVDETAFRTSSRLEFVYSFESLLLSCSDFGYTTVCYEFYKDGWL